MAKLKYIRGDDKYDILNLQTKPFKLCSAWKYKAIDTIFSPVVQKLMSTKAVWKFGNVDNFSKIYNKLEIMNTNTLNKDHLII